MATTVTAIRCPVRGHDHRLILFPDGSLRCMLRDAYRWVRAAALDERNARLPVPSLTAFATEPLPRIMQRVLKPETWDGVVWFRRRRPHWGWPANWRPTDD